MKPTAELKPEYGARSLQDLEARMALRPATIEDAGPVSRILAESFQALYRFTFGALPELAVAGLLEALYRASHLSLEHATVCTIDGAVQGVLVLHIEGAIGKGAASSYWRVLRTRLTLKQSIRAFLGALAANSTLRRRTPTAPDLAYVELLAVSAGMRGRGIGARLLENAISWSAAHGRNRVALHVLYRNAAARRLYERMGFQSWPDMLSRIPRSRVSAAWASLRMIRYGAERPP